MNPIDRIVGFFNPVAGLRRTAARKLLARAYEGANTNDGWRPRRAGASADADHLGDAKRLRDRARSLCQNVPYITRAMSGLCAATVGTGITPESTAKRDADAITALWEQWGAVADADGVHDIYSLQAMAYLTMERDGEVFIRRRMRPAEDGLPVPMQVQVLEADYLDTARAGSTAAGRQIVNGIEYDAIGRVRAYWMFTTHPGSARWSYGIESKPVPAAEIIHLFAPDRPGQGRGITRLAPVIARTRDLMLYEDSELQRKNLETRMGLVASGEVSALSNPPSDYHAGVDGTGADLGVLPSGGITQIPHGLSLTQIEPKAMPGVDAYIKLQLHLIAAGVGVPYETMTGDMSEVNFSSARIRQIDFRRECEQMQWLTLVPRLCNPLWRWFIDAARLAGKVRAPDYGVDWATPRWDYVNPEQDVKAEIAAISAGLLSPTEALRRRGYKPKRVYAEMGADFKAMTDSGAMDLMQFIAGKPPPGSTV